MRKENRDRESRESCSRAQVRQRGAICRMQLFASKQGLAKMPTRDLPPIADGGEADFGVPFLKQIEVKLQLAELFPRQRSSDKGRNEIFQKSHAR